MSEMTDRAPETSPARLAGTRRDILMGGALLAASGGAALLTPREGGDLLKSAKLADLLPTEFGEWSLASTSGLVLPPEDQLRDQLYSRLMTRQYLSSNGRDAVMLLIAYSGRQDSTIQIHRPEVCYPASGFKVTGWQGHEVRLNDQLTLPGRYMVGEAADRVEKVIYWTRVGRFFPTDWWGEHIAVMRENLGGHVPDGMLVRFSAVGRGDLRPVLDRFAAAMVAAARPLLRTALIGTT